MLLHFFTQKTEILINKTLTKQIILLSIENQQKFIFYFQDSRHKSKNLIYFYVLIERHPNIQDLLGMV